MKRNMKQTLLGRAALLLTVAAALGTASCTQDNDEPGGNVTPEGKIALAPTVAPVMAWSTADAAPGTRTDATITTTLTGGEVCISINAKGADDSTPGDLIGCNYYSVSADGKLARLTPNSRPNETEAPLGVDAAGEYFVKATGDVTLTTEGITCLANLANGDAPVKTTIAANGTLSIPFKIASGGLRLNVKNTDGTTYIGADVTATLKTVTQYNSKTFDVKTLTAAAPSAIWGDIAASSVNPDAQILELTVGSKTYKVNAPRQISFTGARLYTFNVRVGATGITVSSDDLGIKDFEVVASTDAEARPTSIWNGTTPTANPSTTFSGGNGTSAAAYVIGSATDLAQLAANVNAGTNYENVYFKLTTDISLNGNAGNNWTPIGTLDRNNASNSKPFKGVFDGDHHYITGLNISSGLDYVGLFGNAAGGTIKNLHVEGNITQTATEPDLGQYSPYIYVGGIAGYSNKISGCSFSGTVTALGGAAGGICGGSWNVTGSKNMGTVTGYIAGGITGYQTNAPVIASYNEGTVTGINKAGGIGGHVSDAGADLESCYNIGVVKAAEGSSADVGALDGTDYRANYCFVKEKLAIVISNGTEPEKEFSATNWPNGSDASSWWYASPGNDGSDKKIWKSLGGWNGGTPEYPKLWWE